MALMVILLTGLWNNLQGIHIEKALSIQRHAADHPIIQGSFHHVCIFSIFGDLKHSSGKEDQTNSRAGLSVNSIIRQIIVKGKSLSMFCSSNGSCHIHLTVHNVLPQLFTGCKKFLVFCSGSHLCHSGIQIYGSYCMAFCLILVPHWLSCLIILLLHISIIPEAFIPILFTLLVKKQRLLTSLVNKIFCQLQMLLIFRDIIQGAEGHLCYLMAWIPGDLAVFHAKMVIDAVCIADSNIQESPFSCSLIICYCRLGHMPQTVQLMMIHKIGKSFFQTIDNIVGVQISVRLLGLSNQLNRLVCSFLQFLIWVPHQGICHCFQPLINITVLEDHALESSFLKPRSYPEVLDAITRFRIFNPVI